MVSKAKNSGKTNNKFLLAGLILALLTMFVYGQVYNFDYVNYDDSDYVYDNTHVTDGLTVANIVWAFTKSHAGNWHPVTWISHMIDNQFFGSSAGWAHIDNFLLHLINTVLLFWILFSLTNRLWCSFFVAAFFAIHPLNVESVAWISERKNVLSTFFWLLTMAVYFRYAKTAKPVWYIALLFVFALGLMAKPMLVTLPFALLLLDYWPLNRLEFKFYNKNTNQKKLQQTTSVFRLILEKLPLLALAVGSSVVTFFVQRASGYMVAKDAFPLPYRLMNMFISYVHYIVKMFWPSSLMMFYPHSPLHSSLPLAFACAALLIAISVFVLFYGRSFKYLLTGWLWYLGTMIPVIGLVQVGDQQMADRYCYVPFVGLFIIAAWGLADLSAKFVPLKKILNVTSILAMIALSVCCWFQVSYWKDSITLFEHAISVDKNNYVAHFSIMQPLEKQGKMQEVIEHGYRAVKIMPNYAQAYNELGNALIKQQQLNEGIDCLLKAVKIDPEFSPAHNNLCVAFTRINQPAQAIKYGIEAIKQAPDYAEAHFNLGLAYYANGQIDDAIKWWQKAVNLKPSHFMARNNLAAMLYQQGKVDEAISQWQQVLIYNPDDVMARDNLAQALQTKNKD